MKTHVSFPHYFEIKYSRSSITCSHNKRTFIMSEEQQQYPPLTPEEEDILFCFKLRGRLSAISFKLVYKNMQKIPAWKYTSTTGHYHYKELNFGSAKDAMEKLDECALQDLTFRKSLSRKVQDERYKAIREELLTAIFYDCECGREPEKKPLPCFYFDAEDEHDFDDLEGEAKEQREAGTTRYKKRLEGAQNQYATSNELGAEMVLDGNRASSKKSKENQKLQFPSAVDCVQRMRKMALQTDTHMNIEDCFKAYGEEWEFLLETGHSLLFHGLGSKKQLLEAFGKKYLRARGDVLSLDGYDPQINIVEILNLLVGLFLNGVDPSSPIDSIESPNDDQVQIGMLSTPNQLKSANELRAMTIAKALAASHSRPIYLLIQGIDGISLRKDAAQRALSSLVLYSNFEGDSDFESRNLFRIVASIDHVDAPLFLWGLETMNNYSWIWNEVNTHEPYYDEIEASIKEGPRKIRSTQQEKVDFVFMKKVLKSIAPKHTAILKGKSIFVDSP